MPLFPASQPELDDVFALPMEPVFSDGENPTTVVSPGLQADASVEVPDYVAQFVPRTGALSRFTAEPARSPASPLGFAAEPASSFSFRAEVETRPAPVPLISQTTLPGPIAATFSPPIPPAAKTAEARNEISADLETPSITVEKEFLGVPAKRVTTASATLGTGIAKLENAMPGAQLSTRHSSSAPENAFVSAATASVSQESVREIGLGAPTATPGTAQQAVEAVLVAVDRAGAGDRHVVNLKFSVGGENLDVRVEVRADAVQATFRTDSAGLRNALSHEWQAANPAQTERSGRIAPPVFASSDTPSFSSSSGEGSPRHREQAATRVEDPLAFSLRQNRAPRAVANNSSLEPRTVLSAAGSALRLHAHA